MLENSYMVRFLVICFCVVLGIDARVSCMLGKHSATEHCLGL